MTAPDNQSIHALKRNRIASRNAIIAKIALFLNYISKTDHDNLTRELDRLTREGNDPPDVLDLMRRQSGISAQDCMTLKKACISFTKRLDDTRFGALCIEFNFLTQSNLELALEEQKRLEKAGRPVRLGDLLVDAGMLSISQKKLVLQKQKLAASARNNGVPASTPAAENDTDPEIDTTAMREISDANFIFHISPDGLTAYVMKTRNFDKSPDADIILKEALERNGIIYGLADSDKLTAFLESDAYVTRPFELACGVPPVMPENGFIEYTFDLDYLKPGQLKPDGSIDFRERGEIPFVSQGDTLAVKTPPVYGKDGINIFGDVVPVAAPEDPPIITGKGVRLSEDKCRAVADVAGNPGLDADGVLCVNDAYFVDGDVDFNTGHVKFDKNIYITGTVKNGFRVEGIDVMADAVDGGIIRARGDVLIKNGISESEVHSLGTISATYIHRSTVTCRRDLKVIKEMVDTEAVMDGMCLLKNGRVYTSVISAKGGAVIRDIGSEKARPSDIYVGTSTYIDTETKRIDARIEAFQNALEASTAEKAGCEKEFEEVTEKLDNLIHSRKRTQAMVDELKKQNRLDNITLFQNSLIEATEKIENLNPRKYILIKKLKKLSQDNQFHSERVTAAIQEKFKIRRLEQNTPSRPILDVGGTIYAGNRVHGKHARTIISKARSRVRIMEVSSSGESSAKRYWDMIITSL